MKLENQVASLEISKRLKELGVKQESLFAWLPITNTEEYGLFYEWHISKDEPISAFTVAELGEMLPKRNKKWNIEGKWSNDWWFRIDQAWSDFCVNYYSDTGIGLIDGNIRDSNIANALGKLLIYLIENGLIEL